ncbi:hypothetical protein ACOBQX_08220 [Actinokineospora sp. G85]|uniref:hypothetical protein n=1 Tax=Actinokineospora sp. G85 TaxID=3406626 RepID=UPI003C760A04
MTVKPAKGHGKQNRQLVFDPVHKRWDAYDVWADVYIVEELCTTPSGGVGPVLTCGRSQLEIVVNSYKHNYILCGTDGTATCDYGEYRQAKGGVPKLPSLQDVADFLVGDAVDCVTGGSQDRVSACGWTMAGFFPFSRIAKVAKAGKAAGIVAKAGTPNVTLGQLKARNLRNDNPLESPKERGSPTCRMQS